MQVKMIIQLYLSDSKKVEVHYLKSQNVLKQPILMV